MRLSFVQTYPLYHGGRSLEEWLGLRNRDRFMPAVAAGLGHEVELLAVGKERLSLTSRGPGVRGYGIEVFPAEGHGGQTRKHFSRDLVTHSRNRAADVHILIGIDGGAGRGLLKDYLLPERRPYAVIVGGKYYNGAVLRAGLVFCETEEQRDLLRRPRWRLWRRSLPARRLARLPKSVDTATFRPAASPGEKSWDVILAGRLLRWKGFEDVTRICRSFRVAVIGDGPEGKRLRRLAPEVEWLGRRTHREVAALMRRARIFYHPGRFDFYPRALAEGFSCGLPGIAVAGGVSPDAIPPGTGFIVDRSEVPARVAALLDDPPLLETMAQAAREHALRELGPESSRAAVRLIAERLGGEDER